MGGFVDKKWNDPLALFDTSNNVSRNTSINFGGNLYLQILQVRTLDPALDVCWVHVFLKKIVRLSPSGNDSNTISDRLTLSLDFDIKN